VAIDRPRLSTALYCPPLPGPVPCLRSHERVCASARGCAVVRATPSQATVQLGNVLLVHRRVRLAPRRRAGELVCSLVHARERVRACCRAWPRVGPVRRRRALWSTASLSRCSGHSPPCSAVLIAPPPPRHHCHLLHGTGPARVTPVLRSRPMALGSCLRSVRSSGPARRARRRSARRWAASCETIRCCMSRTVHRTRPCCIRYPVSALRACGLVMMHSLLLHAQH
jgi:hypothetical protein